MDVVSMQVSLSKIALSFCSKATSSTCKSKVDGEVVALWVQDPLYVHVTYRWRKKYYQKPWSLVTLWPLFTW